MSKTGRLERFRALKDHAWYGRSFRRLGKMERLFCERWIEDRTRLNRNEFEIAVNRMWLDRERPKNWSLIVELMLSGEVKNMSKQTHGRYVILHPNDGSDFSAIPFYSITERDGDSIRAVQLVGEACSLPFARQIVACLNACERHGQVIEALDEAAEWLSDEISPSGDVPEGLPQLQRKIRAALDALGV